MPANDDTPPERNEFMKLKFGEYADYYKSKSIGFTVPPAREACEHKWHYMESRDAFYCVHCRTIEVAE